MTGRSMGKTTIQKQRRAGHKSHTMCYIWLHAFCTSPLHVHAMRNEMPRNPPMPDAAMQITALLLEPMTRLRQP